MKRRKSSKRLKKQPLSLSPQSSASDLLINGSNKSLYRLFVDPASKSSGWALFKDREFQSSGTILAEGKDPFKRLFAIYSQYYDLGARLADAKQSPSEIHIEQLPRRCHIYTHWSVAVAGVALLSWGGVAAADIPIKGWQKDRGWEKARLLWKENGFSSEDEMAATYMGVYWVNNRVGSGAGGSSCV